MDSLGSHIKITMHFILQFKQYGMIRSDFNHFLVKAVSIVGKNALSKILQQVSYEDDPLTHNQKKKISCITQWSFIELPHNSQALSNDAQEIK